VPGASIVAAGPYRPGGVRRADTADVRCPPTHDLPRAHGAHTLRTERPRFTRARSGIPHAKMTFRTGPAHHPHWGEPCSPSPPDRAFRLAEHMRVGTLYGVLDRLTADELSVHRGSGGRPLRLGVRGRSDGRLRGGTVRRGRHRLGARHVLPRDGPRLAAVPHGARAASPPESPLPSRRWGCSSWRSGSPRSTCGSASCPTRCAWAS